MTHAPGAEHLECSDDHNAAEQVIKVTGSLLTHSDRSRIGSVPDPWVQHTFGSRLHGFGGTAVTCDQGKVMSDDLAWSGGRCCDQTLRFR